MATVKIDAGTDNNPVDFSSTSAGNYRQNVVISSAFTDANTATVSDTGRLSVQTQQTIIATNATISAVGDVASGSADSGNPVKVGYVARTALPTAVSAGQRINAQADKFGRQVVIPQAFRDIVGTNYTIIAMTGETTIIPAQGSGVFADLVGIMVTNTGSTFTAVTVRDTPNGGTIFAVLIPAGEMRGAIFSTPVPQTTANNAWTAQLSNSIVAHVSTQFIKNQ